MHAGNPLTSVWHVALNDMQNYDVMDLVSTLTDYCFVMDEILKQVQHG